MCNGCKDCKCEGNSIKITDLSQVVCELNAIHLELSKIDHDIAEDLSLRVKKCMDTILGIVHKSTSKQNLPVVTN